MSLTNDDVHRIARLARIAVSREETAAVVDRLNGVLALVDQMRRVDTAGVELMAHALDVRAQSSQPLRADEVSEADRRPQFQAAAPAIEEGLYLVPKVIE